MRIRSSSPPLADRGNIESPHSQDGCGKTSLREPWFNSERSDPLTLSGDDGVPVATLCRSSSGSGALQLSYSNRTLGGSVSKQSVHVSQSRACGIPVPETHAHLATVASTFLVTAYMQLNSYTSKMTCKNGGSLAVFVRRVEEQHLLGHYRAQRLNLLARALSSKDAPQNAQGSLSAQALYAQLKNHLLLGLLYLVLRLPWWPGSLHMPTHKILPPCPARIFPLTAAPATVCCVLFTSTSMDVLFGAALLVSFDESPAPPQDPPLHVSQAVRQQV